jgi:glycosyltransferase involved in cell wall biosynthesis
LNVLTITPFYPTASDDAGGCFIAEPLAELAKLGVANEIFAVSPRHHAIGPLHPQAPRATSIQYAAIPSNWGLASSGSFLASSMRSWIRKLRDERRVDLIHAHSALPCGHAAMLLGRELGIPFVVTVHGLDAYSDRQARGLAGSWCRRVSTDVFRAARRVLCISSAVERLVRAGTDCNTAILYNSADPNLFYPAPKSADPRTIVCVGNMIPIKGHEVLLRAFAEVAKSEPGIVCELIGDGPERQRLTALCTELGIAGKVKFLGRRSRREVAGALRKATVFALPSTYEGLGCVYLEAMLSGTVAIGCSGQGIADIIHHRENGWLVAPNSVSEMAQALTTLLGDSALLESLAARGRETVLSSLTTAQQAQQLLSLYRECAA